MDHAVSGDSCVIPEVFVQCAGVDSRSVRIDLLKRVDLLYSDGTPSQSDRADAAVRQKFAEILVKSGCDILDLRSAHLEIITYGEPGEEWPRYSCESVIVAKSGRVFSRKMDSANYWDSKQDDPLAEIQKKIRDTWVGGGRS